jgi:hypothetical protein
VASSDGRSFYKKEKLSAVENEEDAIILGTDLGKDLLEIVPSDLLAA